MKTSRRSRAWMLPAALLLSWGAASAAAQEITWVETRFHRVYLNNGNFIDGHVAGVTDSSVFVRMTAGEMVIRKDSIDRIELVKLRSIREKPILDPPLKKSPAGGSGSSAPRVKSDASFPPAPASPELIDNVRMLLSRLKIAKPDQKDGLILQLSGLSDSGAYQASLLPTSEEETVYYLKSSLMRSKDPEAVPYLVHALESDKLFVQLESITLLGILGNLDVTRHLRPFLADSVPAIKSAAIGALQQLADPYAVEGIAELVGDQDDMVRVAAINASLELGKTHNRMDLVSESVRRNLNGADGRVAKELLSMVSRGKMAELWKSVLPFLSDPDALLRKTAAVTLQGIEVPETAEIVVTRLQQEDDLRTLIELTRAASKIKSTTAVPALIHLLGHADPDVVQASAASLEALTRQHFGTNKSKWTQWWDLNQTK